MKKRVGRVFLALMFAGAAFGGTDKFELRASYGGWTFAPFMTAVERASERLASQEYDLIVGSLLLGQLLPEFNPEISMSSSGHFLSFGGWYNLTDRWSVGVEGDVMTCRLPFSMNVTQVVAVLGYPLATIHAEGPGTVRLNSFVVSVLGRWAPVRTRTLAVYLKAGAMAFPYHGTFSVDLTARVETELGTFTWSGPVSQTIDEMRDLGVDAPEIFISPLAGVILQARILRGAGLYLDATISQGTFLSGGIFFSF